MHPFCNAVALLATLVVPLAASRAAGTAAIAPVAEPGRLLFEDDFAPVTTMNATDLEHEGRWAVEQQPGGTVTVGGGRMIIEDRGGCTVWFMQKLKAPVVITYEATVSSTRRVSDLNCFWMATDPKRPDLPAPFVTGMARSGKFEDYDGLRTYYVGHGGNNNTTTRFRRYAGDGTKPLRPEHDLGAREFLLAADHAYTITLIAAFGRAQYLCDGTVIFDHRDPAPLGEGLFGFRTVNSRIEIRKFRVYAAKNSAGRLSGPQATAGARPRCVARKAWCSVHRDPARLIARCTRAGREVGARGSRSPSARAR